MRLLQSAMFRFSGVLVVWCALASAWTSPLSVPFSIQRRQTLALLRHPTELLAFRGAPLPGLATKIPVLEDWKVLRNGRVQGTVWDHPSIPNGDTITTSPIENPEQAAPRRIVTTYTGSKYQLGEPAFVMMKTGKVTIQELQRKARSEKGLTGEVVGDEDRQYLLCVNPGKSTSGKSRIYKAYVADGDGLPMGDPVLVKLSSNWEALEREHGNYGRITRSGVARGQFVKLYAYYPTASMVTPKFRGFSALVLERGLVDLKKYIAQNGRLEGKQLRDAAAAAAQCLQAVHTSQLVWTDMKTENFVVLEDGTVKGIDLESAMPVRDNPVDYSPEATPPEFAKAFLAGDGPYFVLDYNYDMWSFGMLLFEIATGRSYFEGKTPVQITRSLKSEPEITLDKEKIDPKLKDLIRKCLQLNPKSRPNILQVLLHPYFLTTGLGPFGF